MQRYEARDVDRLPLFAGLRKGQRSRLLSAASVRRCSVETILFREDDTADFLHVLLAGTVELYRSDRTRELGLMLLSPGDVFMPAAALFGEPYLNSARTLSSATILLLPSEDARREFARTHRFAINVGRVLAGQFRMATRHILDLKCRSAPQRLADFLLRLVDEGGDRVVGDLPVSKTRLAARIGMAPETLSRSFQTLAENGLVVRGTRILVRDRSAIEKFCGPAPYADPAEAGLDVHAL